jgi:ADP-ribose pyrophosphatase YjhB (NUDIX family)
MTAPVELCVGAIVVLDGQLLLVQRANEPSAGEWSVPGGRVEPGETLAEAVVRELGEETGLEGVCGPLVGWVERIDERHHFVILDFEVTVLGDDAGARRRRRRRAWVPLEDVAEWLPSTDSLSSSTTTASSARSPEDTRHRAPERRGVGRFVTVPRRRSLPCLGASVTVPRRRDSAPRPVPRALR